MVAITGNRDRLRQAIVRVVNATFSIRDAGLWGAGTACASDPKKFGSWESNLMTERHARYRGPGVMIYWHVEKNSVCIYSQDDAPHREAEGTGHVDGVSCLM